MTASNVVAMLSSAEDGEGDLAHVLSDDFRLPTTQALNGMHDVRELGELHMRCEDKEVAIATLMDYPLPDEIPSVLHPRRRYLAALRLAMHKIQRRINAIKKEQAFLQRRARDEAGGERP